VNAQQAITTRKTLILAISVMLTVPSASMLPNINVLSAIITISYRMTPHSVMHSAQQGIQRPAHPTHVH